MLRQFDKLGKPLEELPSAIAVQLNDTHPAMAIPELIRLLNKRGVRFAKALDIARRVFAYTNHTVMQEALEKWDVELLRSVAPEIARIIVRIDEMFRKELAQRGVDANGLAIVENGQGAHGAAFRVCHARGQRRGGDPLRASQAHGVPPLLRIVPGALHQRHQRRDAAALAALCDRSFPGSSPGASARVLPPT